MNLLNQALYFIVVHHICPVFLCLFSSTKALREGKRCVTAHWLNTVLKKKVMVPPHRTLHVPFAFPPGAKPCSQHVCSSWSIHSYIAGT